MKRHHLHSSLSSLLTLCLIPGSCSFCFGQQRPKTDETLQQGGTVASPNNIPHSMRGHWRLDSVETGDGVKYDVINFLQLGLPDVPETASKFREFFRLNEIGSDSICVKTSVGEKTWKLQGQVREHVFEFRGTTESESVSESERSLQGRMWLDGDTLARRTETSSGIRISRFKKHDDRRTTVFLIHGTYGGASHWARVIHGKCTFASELQNAAGTAVVHIEPFLWRSSVQHEARDRAAQDLAALIDSERFKNDRLILIGHSHGGNVAMAAVGKAQRPVDTVICLATPHILLKMTDEKQKLQLLPVYCTPDARARIGRLINLQLSADAVVGLWADIRRGIDEPTAVKETYPWREKLNHPRLADDGGPIQEVLEELIEAQLTDNLIVAQALEISDHQSSIPCDIAGTEAHSAIVSCRMGQVLGGLIQSNFSDKGIQYLQSTVIPADSKAGEPISIDDRNCWWKEHEKQFHHSGWILQGITVASNSTRRSSGGDWDADQSWPDLLMKTNNGILTQSTRHRTDAQHAQWNTSIHVALDNDFKATVFDNDLLFRDEMDTSQISIGKDPPVAGQTLNNVSIQYSWRYGHH